MKKRNTLLIIIIIISIFNNARAADLLVEDNGIFPAFSSISNAVSAATNGDRIIIRNHPTGIPWIENITVDKSLEFLSYDNDTFFIVQGSYTIQLAQNRTVTFIGMKNLSGGISFSGSASTFKTTTVNFMDGYLVNGSIALETYYVNLNLVSSTLLNGAVQFRFGKIIGNDISFFNTSQPLYLNNAGTFQNDTTYITGNKITQNYDGYEGMYINDQASICQIKNNFIRHKSSGILITGTPNYAATNQIYNNTIVGTNGNYTHYAISINYVQANTIIEIMNNVADDNSALTSFGIYKGSNVNGQVDVYFNHIANTITNPISSGFTFSANNQTGVPITIAVDGQVTSGTPINGGNPAAPFYDLDLTPGDAGCYGGSFTLDNFFPLYTGPARVYFVNYPFNVRQGSILNINANAYDR